MDDAEASGDRTGEGTDFTTVITLGTGAGSSGDQIQPPNTATASGTSSSSSSLTPLAAPTPRLSNTEQIRVQKEAAKRRADEENAQLAQLESDVNARLAAIAGEKAALEELQTLEAEEQASQSRHRRLPCLHMD